MLFAQLAVVFVGVAGNHHEAVSHQLEPVLEKAGVETLVVPVDDLGAIVRHTHESQAIVRGFHVDAVIAGSIVVTGRKRTFRVIVYDGEGNLTSDGETPFPGPALTKTDLDAFGTNVHDVVESARRRHPPPAVAAVAADTHDTTGRGELVDGGPSTVAPARSTRVHAGLTLGIVSRSMSPDPGTIKSYSSTPVGTGGLEIGAEPVARVSIAGAFEHTLEMSTPIAGTPTSTAISRWQLSGAYSFLRAGLVLAPVFGFGHRSFSVDSTSTSRSPDTDYTYLIFGASVQKNLGARFQLRGALAYEPVVSSADPMMVGEASRWGFDLGVALEMHPRPHVFARAAFDYQQFSWTWTMPAGGNAGATDGYPTGTLAAGAEF